MLLNRKAFTRLSCAILLGALLTVYSYGQTALLTPVILKIVTYDETFQNKNPLRVNVVVVYDESDANSKTQFISVEEYFENNPRMTIKDSKVVMIESTVDNLDNVLATLSGEEYTILLLTEMSKSKVKSVINSKGDLEIHSFSFAPEDIHRGIAVSIDPSQKRQSIIVNLPTSIAEGSRFDTRLLRMCKVIGAGE